jgi:hypothetical protein
MDDNQLWKIAKARVEFKAHLRKYLFVNALLWIIWLIVNISNQGSHWTSPWPVYVSLIWGIILFIQFYNTYLKHIDDPVKKEFEKLKKKNDDPLDRN